MKEAIVDIMEKFLSSRLSDVHTAIPGTFKKYSGHAERRATVLPMIKKETVNYQLVEIKAISDVPVIFPSTHNASVLFPIEKGDGCLLIFSEAGFENWVNGDNKTQVNPGDKERFQLGDCVAIPGLFPFGDIPDAPANDDSLFVTFKDSFMELTGSMANINNNFEVDV